MEITQNLRRRFVKDTGLPIKVFQSPYFESRLAIFERDFGAATKYDAFVKMLENYQSEADFFNEQDRVKQSAMDYLFDNAELLYFCQKADMGKFSPKNVGYPTSGVFKDCHVGKYLLSIDMVKANFTALRHYDLGIFDGDETYEEFMGRFTDSDYIKSSKYIRQIIFGNFNPKRIQTYEHYLMDMVLSSLFDCTHIIGKNVLYFGSDEIVIDVSEFVHDGELDPNITESVKNVVDNACFLGINVRSEYYQLGKVIGTNGYFKLFKFESADKRVEFKCLDSIEFPFVLRAYNGEALKDEDFVFMYEKRLAKLMEPIPISFTTSLN